MRLSVRFSGLLVTFAVILSLFGVLFLSEYRAHAAPGDSLSVTCSRTQASGQVNGNAPYVRVQITLASDLTHVIASKVVRVHRNGRYALSVNYDRQPRNTLLVVSVGEWDGQQYLAPATITSRQCNAHGGSTPS